MVVDVMLCQQSRELNETHTETFDVNFTIHESSQIVNTRSTKKVFVTCGGTRLGGCGEFFIVRLETAYIYSF